MASTTETLCPDRVFLNNSNVHVAKDREWFTTYTPFESVIGPQWGPDTSAKSRVLGVGTVELTMKRTPYSGVKVTILLTDVLYVPDSVCNIIGSPLYCPGSELSVLIGYHGGITIKSTREIIVYFDIEHEFYAVQAVPPSGKQLGPSAFGKDKVYMLNCHWDEVERMKWEEYDGAQKMSSIKEQNKDYKDRFVYTAEEKQFMKNHWGGEYKLLSQNGLNIHDNDDREEGRSILRALMRKGQRK